MRINIDGVSLLEAKASAAGNYNYYMDITEYASKLFGTGIVERALLEVVSCANAAEDGAEHITKVAGKNVGDALRQICEGASLLYGDRDLIIKFTLGKVLCFCSAESSAVGETAMPDI